MRKKLSTREKLLKRAEAFAAKHDTSLEAIGMRVVRNSHCLTRVRDGKDITTRNLDKLNDYFDEVDRSDKAA